MTVKGRFGRYDGTLDLRQQPAIDLTIEAASLDTKNKMRDKHLRSADFFDVANHPQVRFVSDSAKLESERLTVSGRLEAAGKSMPLNIDATLRRVDDELEVDATAHADQFELGMSSRHARHDPHPERTDRPWSALRRLTSLNPH